MIKSICITIIILALAAYINYNNGNKNASTVLLLIDALLLRVLFLTVKNRDNE